jgi:protein TonB
VPLGSSVSLGDLYPSDLQDDDVEGSADVECDVDTTGRTSNCKIDATTGSHEFGSAALRYAQGNTYRPATHNGVAIAGHHRWRVRFQLKD